MEVKTVGIACDHAGFPLKQFVVEYLKTKGYAFKDFGTFSDESVDYPDFAHPLAQAIEDGEVYPGIAICGSGEGMAIPLNKPQGVRAGLAWNKDIAAAEILDSFFSATFEGGRHERRVKKIAK